MQYHHEVALYFDKTCIGNFLRTFPLIRFHQEKCIADIQSNRLGDDRVSRTKVKKLPQKSLKRKMPDKDATNVRTKKARKMHPNKVTAMDATEKSRCLML